MGIARRIAELYGARVNALLDELEDPREMVDYSYQRQQELLISVRRGLVEVTASRERAATQAAAFERDAGKLSRQAEQALEAGQEELARQALARRATLRARAGDLRQQEAALRDDEHQLSAASQRLQAKTEAFALRKEAIKAGYTAARLTAGASEVAGVSEEMGDASLATRRAVDKTARARARADALDELMAAGTPGAGAPAAARGKPQLGAEELQARLDEVASQAAVDEELARLKERLAHGGSAPPSAPSS